MSNPLSPDPNQNLLPSTSFSALNWNPQEPNPAVILQSDLLIGHINQNPNITALTPNPSDSLLLAQIEGSIATIDPNITLPNDNSFDGLTGEAMDIVKEQLTQFAKVPNFVEKMNLAFGESWDNQAANVLTQDWLNGDFSSIPPVEFVSSAEIGGANGAFAAATDTIYLSRELLAENGANPATVADVLLEEIGHSVDSRLNITDAPGDEGAVFAAVVQDKVLSEGELQGLRGESDRGTVVLGGENTTIEMSQQQWTIRSYSDWRNRTVDWNKPDKTSDQNGNRQDGKDGIYIDWRIGSPFDPPNNLEGGNNPDYFATFGYTKASFEAGGTYKFRVSADDGIVIGVRQVGQSSNQTIITPRSQDGKVQWEIRPWGKEYSWSPTQTGEYYVIFQHCEVTGNAGVDISWEKATPVPNTITVANETFPVELSFYNELGNNLGKAERSNIDPNKDTIVVIHGKGDGNPDSNMNELARVASNSNYYPNSQVLYLDWKEAANDGFSPPLWAASRIRPVADWAVKKLKELGIDHEKTILLGHSLGSYVASEIGRISGGVKELVALDPAYAGDNYDIDGNNSVSDRTVNFRDVATKSIALVASEDGVSGIAGDNLKALTAETSYLVDFNGYQEGWNAMTDYHKAVVGVFSDILSFKSNPYYTSYSTPSNNEQFLAVFSSTGLFKKDGYGPYEAVISVDLTNKNNPRIESLNYLVDSLSGVFVQTIPVNSY
ncbi:MAG TPA: hypothetical protein DEF27_12035 [Oscillatoriales bacterium UBA8482]|nr:MAG: hypothetical protein AUK43_20730 [Oscillatoriales cyanobacterium CG2_30_40_61]HBW58481.1 hypothetical protein [Oscillatoriales bacterium UBA8482]